MLTFTDCAPLGAPNWEATEGRFALAPDGRLRYTRSFRCKRGKFIVHLDGDTPRDLEKRLQAYKAKPAAVAP